MAPFGRSAQSFRFQVLGIALAAGLLWLSGCGSRSDLGQVKGRVTLDGKPLANAYVEFVPKGAGSTSYGKTDADGNYETMFSMTAYGSSLGESIVRITTSDIYIDERGRERRSPELLPDIYNQNSTLIANVEPGSNTIDFDLQSKPQPQTAGR